MKEQNPPIRATEAKRRSTRVVQAVQLVITRSDAKSKTAAEETATLSINCHGFRYFSKYRTRKGEKITVQIIETKEDKSFTIREVTAKVAWTKPSKRLDDVYQVGVEFESPQNIWDVKAPPEDWQFFPAADKEDPTSLLADIERLLEFARAGSHYQLLDVQSWTDQSQIKSHFHRLALRFHPDRHMDRPEWTPQLLILMEALNTAYKILSDEEAKRQYDTVLAQGAKKELSEPKRMVQGCLEKARECLAEKNYVGSILWMRRAIENEPNSSSHRAMLAQSLANVPEYRREAVEQFEQAIELDPNNLMAHLDYARMLEQIKLPWRARPHYVRVLELDMYNREARDRLNRLDSGAPRSASRPSLLGRLKGLR